MNISAIRRKLSVCKHCRHNCAANRPPNAREPERIRGPLRALVLPDNQNPALGCSDVLHLCGAADTVAREPVLECIVKGVRT